MVNFIPLLRFKRGEMSALRNVRAATKAGVIPYFDVSADRFRGRRQTANRAAVSPPDNIAQTLIDNWGDSRCFMDATKVAPQPGQHHPIIQIFQSVAARGGDVVPATNLAADPAYQQAVQHLHNTHGCNVCLKVDLAEFNSAQNWIGGWGIPIASTHLVLDVGQNVQNVNALGNLLQLAFLNLPQGSDWASVTFAGTSIPETFQGYAQGLYDLNRDELNVWRRLSGLGLPYTLHFGDYTTVSMTAAPAQIRWGYPMTAKYTLDTTIKVCRGVKTTGPNAVDMGPQLLGHARSIVALPNRNAIPGCWADAQIDSIANASRGPGNLETWVSIGVNRHIELTRQQLP